MIDRELTRQLDRVARRLRTFRFWSGMGMVWILGAILVGAIYFVSKSTGHIVAGGVFWATSIALIGSLVVYVVSMRSARNVRQVASRIENVYPQLDSALVTAVEQVPDARTGRLGYLQREVVNKAVYHALSHNWELVVSRGKMAVARLSAYVGVALMAVAALALGSLNKDLAANQPEPDLNFEDVVLNGANYEATIEPGDTEVERGTSLLVLARFADRLPPEATLTYTSDDGQEHAVAMSQSLDDPLLGGRIASVTQPLTYRVAFANQVTRDFNVTVFEYPLLLQTDAKLVFPSYTGQEEKFIQDVRRVSAVEGSELTLYCKVNKPLASARFVEQTKEGEETIELAADSTDPLTYSTKLIVDRSRELTLHLTDDAGRTNKHPPELRITMIANLPPDIKLAQPTRDIEVSPIEEVDLAASAWDDFGLKRVGISYSIPGKLDREVALGDSFPTKERIQTEHLLAFEELSAEPDELLSWYFWAEDIGPSGEVRRTSSDMFFAEVRPFEEIFRQGQQPPDGSQQQQQQQQQQGGQNAQQAQQLAELQKQIINATWKIIRRETRAEPTDTFADDVTLIAQSQVDALTQLAELEQNLQDVESIEHAIAVRKNMTDAQTTLEEAVSELSIEKLKPALQFEQAAYQGLLRLRAREHEVVESQQSQQQSQQSQQSQNSRSQQQLQQLQLREDENRYAQEQQAQTEEEQEAREDRQILNRLRELAQRQEDLNERIKELQGALEAAETEEERAEAERQLKRLREEQEEILRDTDELQERMEQPENQERMAEQRQQLEEARENTRRSSEALQQQMVTQAANEGTRAQQGLDDLKEEFQKRTSGEFEEEVREMRQQAQDLVQEEEKLAQQLENMADGSGENNNSLRESDGQDEVEKQLAEQKERLDNLLERMRETIEQAEDSQPLLAEKLYESIRNTRKSDPKEALETTEMLLDRGFLNEASQQERQAREGINQLAEGVEQAAEQILGDETDALRRALSELDRLNQDLEGELARAEGRQPNRPSEQPTADDPNAEQNGDGSPRQPGQPQDAQQQQGQQQQGQQQQGQQQQGQQQQGQQQQGQQQQGQQQQGQQQQGQQQQGQQQGGNRGLNDMAGGGLDRFLNQGGFNPTAPFSGNDFVDWSDRLRDVEEIVDDPELRAEAARIRDEAREIRREILDTSAPPQWDIIQERIARPLTRLQNRVAEELLKRTKEDARVPIDKDPVPVQYENAVRRYYERLGGSE
ncbi:hypothetical protein [Blastopirellula marina]|uniref:DUF4175 domain-containing protein n=1 Tax=Blastopirellula marina TaxID=124 RepID=A0A2S8F9N5_9BACT|nr:hypothetical protein [Blastopirellula marina]PQO28851.1 hypothetical protein C5Y98_24110 [Blastopirellula marina]PTL42124.1 hypothetical protein C5Y97_24125 [Blastopirellula marina]